MGYLSGVNRSKCVEREVTAAEGTVEFVEDVALIALYIYP